MSNYKAVFRRGLKSSLPTLPIGNFAYTTDTKELYVGSESGNVKIGGATNTDLFIDDFTTNLNGLDESVKNQILGFDLLAQNSNHNGFINRVDSTISYNPSTRSFNISGTFYYYNNSKRYNKINVSETVTHSNITGNYFVYYIDDVLTITSAVWNYKDHTPIALITYNAATATNYWIGPSGFATEERHGIVMDWATHELFHENIGTIIENNSFFLSGYTEGSGTGGLTDVTFGITQGIIGDEDIHLILPELIDNNGIGNVYPIFYRTGNQEEWRWHINNIPILTRNNYILRNNFNNGIWEFKEVIQNSYYVNMYLCAIPSITSQFRYILIMGQNEVASLDSSNMESMSDLNLNGIPFEEIAPIYKITFKTGSSYSTDTGKARIDKITRIVGNKISITTSLDSNTLSGIHLMWGEIYGGSWDTIPYVHSNGMIGVGKGIDFHNIENDPDDYSVRLTTGDTTTDMFINITGKIWHSDNDDDLIKRDGSVVFTDKVESQKVIITPEGGLAVKMTNRTGSSSVKGTIVSCSTSYDNAFKIATNLELTVIGIVYSSGVADGSECWVVINGIAEVLMKDSTASDRSYLVMVSSTNGRSDSINPATLLLDNTKILGHFIENKTGGTNVLAKAVIHLN
jgi:hypothetical protein